MARGRHPTRIHIDPPSAEVSAKYLCYWYGRDLHNASHNFPPLTSIGIFGNDRPLEIDFGCGTGALVCERARQNPKINMIGIDLSQKPLFCAVYEAAESGLENIKFIRGDFAIMLPLLLPGSISAAYYLFPNPPRDYLRDRANERRRCFLQSIYSALIRGGRFYFATDANEFFKCVRDIARLELLFEPHGIENTDLATHYRQIWERHGRAVQSFMVEKK
jgi:tRNA (guanine-N7-)-methyltransferase